MLIVDPGTNWSQKSRNAEYISRAWEKPNVKLTEEFGDFDSSQLNKMQRCAVVVLTSRNKGVLSELRA